MSYEIGDVILCGVIVGVVTKPGRQVVCAGSDGKEHTFNEKNCTLVCSYKDTLIAFERGIRSCC